MKIVTDLFQKFGKRTFAAPASASALAFFNDAAQMGFDFKTMVLVNAGALAWALIETWRDTTAMKYGLYKAPEAPQDPAAPPAPKL